ncbi:MULTISPECIES: hypothetical protein [unclassified Bradyrhizobium]|uniref:hypothetical protein n=1 Tax=unclassified Bradyrhizobium TaxID=2631580 RepID=UPI0028E91D56|nr:MULTISPECIES: hypothetical protein [unclassified Bradyrhizobium]
MSMLYPRLIAVHRARTVAGANDAVGNVGYSGMGQSSDPANPIGEDVLFTKIPANIQAEQTGRKKDSALPSDPVFAPTWAIYVPKRKLKLGDVRDRDIIVDDLGYRYQVGQDYWNLLGYKLVCIRLEA